jgi:cytidine deaminase
VTAPRRLARAEEDRLIEAATKARAAAAAPYSGFHVGAALLCEDGSVRTGCNIESATYGLTICAERTAVFKAVSEGVRGFRAVAVVTGAEDPTPPCGACRQVLWDQCGEVLVIMGTLSGKRERRKLSSLFPRPFEFGGPK